MVVLDLHVELGDVELKFKQVAQLLERQNLLNESSAILLSRVRTRFLQEKDAEGSSWQPSDRGIKRRSGGYTRSSVTGKLYTGTGTLFESGNLFHSIQASRLNDSEHAIATDVVYGKYLIGRWNFLGFGREDGRFLEEYWRRKLEAL